MSDQDLIAKKGTDAVKWTDEFLSRFPHEPHAAETLSTWFANAIEAGRDAATPTPPGDGCPCGHGR